MLNPDHATSTIVLKTRLFSPAAVVLCLCCGKFEKLSLKILTARDYRSIKTIKNLNVSSTTTHCFFYAWDQQRYYDVISTTRMIPFNHEWNNINKLLSFYRILVFRYFSCVLLWYFDVVFAPVVLRWYCGKFQNLSVKISIAKDYRSTKTIKNLNLSSTITHCFLYSINGISRVIMKSVS